MYRSVLVVVGHPIEAGILCHLENYCWDEGAKMQVNGTVSCCESGVKWSLLLVSFSL